MIPNKQKVLEEINKTIVNTAEYQLLTDKEQNYTVLCSISGITHYLHSKYDALKSAKQFAEAIYKPDENIVLYGLALGYHVFFLQEMLRPNQLLYVLECNSQTTKLAFENTEILSVLENDNIVFHFETDLRAAAVFLDDLINKKGYDLEIYEPSLKIVPKSMEKIKDVLTEYKAGKEMLPLHTGYMRQNLEINAKAGYANGIELFKDSFRNMPVIIVSAGASLDLSLKDLYAARQKALILCVTRAAHSLKKAGIRPDFYIATDAVSWLTVHLDFESMEDPIFFLSTADSNVANYRGIKLILYEKSSCPVNKLDYAVESGGSVSTAALSVSTLLGGNPIIFLGQDLCYWNEKTHSGDAYEHISFLKSSKTVEANDGNIYPTRGNLYIYKNWIERFIKRNTGKSFYNATVLGAKIDGAPNVELLKFFENYPDIREDMENTKQEKLKIL